MLREAWAWREELASRRDRPVFRVLRDEVLVAVVRARPASIDELARVAGFPDVLRRAPQAPGLVAAVQKGAACPQADWPALRVDTRVRLAPAVAARVEVIRAKRDGVASELGLDPTLIAGRAVMDDLAKRHVAGEDPWAAPELRAWQAELLRPLLG